MGRAIVEALARFPKWIAKRNSEGLESTFHTMARDLSGRSLARQIGEVDLDAYQASLSRSLAEALTSAAEHQAKAVLFEYDMDDAWSSRFLICTSYAPESAGNEEWSTEWAAQIEGPGVPEFGRIYQKYGFDRSDQAKGSSLYMIARTVAVMLRCAPPGPVGAAALCMGYRDQNPIHRIWESSRA